MIGLVATLGFIALNVGVIAAVGARQYGSLRAWWTS